MYENVFEVNSVLLFHFIGVWGAGGGTSLLDVDLDWHDLMDTSNFFSSDVRTSIMSGVKSMKSLGKDTELILGLDERYDEFDEWLISTLAEEFANRGYKAPKEPKWPLC